MSHKKTEIKRPTYQWNTLLPLFMRRDLGTSQTSQFVGAKFLPTIFVMKTQAENLAKYSRDKRKTDHGQTKLNNMVVKKSVLNEINKEGTFTQGFKD